MPLPATCSSKYTHTNSQQKYQKTFLLHFFLLWTNFYENIISTAANFDFFFLRFLFIPLFDSSYFYKKIKLSMVRSSFSQILLSFFWRLLPIASMVSVCTVIFQFKIRFWKALYCSWVLIMRLFSHTVSRMEFLPSFARMSVSVSKTLNSSNPIQPKWFGMCHIHRLLFIRWDLKSLRRLFHRIGKLIYTKETTKQTMQRQIRSHTHTQSER